jgi:hypothetical protein
MESAAVRALYFGEIPFFVDRFHVGHLFPENSLVTDRSGLEMT